jgi:hypothetical protein
VASSQVEAARGGRAAVGEGPGRHQADGRRPRAVRWHIEGRSAAPTRAMGGGGRALGGADREIEGVAC